MRLSKIDNGTVACMHVETGDMEQCDFGRKSGRWLESKKGRFAVAGQAITLDGKPGGEYVTASKIGPDATVPALEPQGNDMASSPSVDQELGDPGVVIEELLSPNNVTGQPLVNWATLEVCTSSYPHPDGARVARYYWGGSNWIFCYRGTGAGLNDSSGAERDGGGYYYPPWLWSSRPAPTRRTRGPQPPSRLRRMH